LYENRIVGDPIDCCDSFQLKEKVADFFGEVRSESENFCFCWGILNCSSGGGWIGRRRRRRRILWKIFAHLCVFMVDFGRLGARIFGGIFGNDYNPARGECGAFGDGVV
jgi:hypothetical protein